MSENDHVRVLKIHYGPHEKSVMHSHPASVVVFLADAKVRFHLPGGKTEDVEGKSGDAKYSAAGTHLPENTGDAGMDAVLIELKGHTNKPEHATKK